MDDLLVRIRADVSGFMNGIRKTRAELAGLDRNTRSNQRSLASWIRIGATSTAALGLGKLIKDSVSLEAAYSKTMAQIAVATDAPKSQLKELDALALKMGKDTVFSAQDAADAMLELGKGGLSVAQIKAGALAETMTLAAAGGMELGEAANTVIQNMGAFGLEADQAKVAVAALAGGANASSASLDDMVQALRQSATVANSAGLSIQETTGMLALLADQGIKGSDAGTSLRTMLSRLVPNTKAAKQAMEELNLSYVDGNGNMVDAAEIAARTQKAFKGLSDEERSRAIQTIFGQDAQRAVNALIKEGADGLAKYTDATGDLTQAQKLAKAANSGTQGSLEQLRGSIETAQIQFGKGLAPTVQWAAKELNKLASSGDMEEWGRKAGSGVQAFVREAAPLARSLFELAHESWPAVSAAAEVATDVLGVAADVAGTVVDVFNELPDAAQNAILLGGGLGLLARRAGGGGLVSNLAAIAIGAGNVGDKSGKATPKVAAFAGSLKRMAGAGAVITFGLQGLDDIGTLKNNLDGVQGPLKSTSQILTEMNSGNVGKFAGDLGIDVEKLAASLAESGSKGEYASKVLQDMYDRARGWDQLGGTIAGPFWNSTGEKAAALRMDLKEIAAEIDKILGKGGGGEAGGGKPGQWSQRVNETANSIRLGQSALKAYRDQLVGLPTEVVTKITTPGAVESKADVVQLARLYDLTPDEVRTIMEALDFANPKIRDVLDHLANLDNSSANPTIDAEDKGSEKVSALQARINRLKGKTVYVNTVYTYTTQGMRARDAASKRTRRGNADGSIMEFYAEGGLRRENHVAQIAPAGTIRVWNEPETEGEAYIPLAPSKRARSMAILRETAERFGVQVLASGGVTAGSGSGSAAFDYDRLAQAFAREFPTAFEITADGRGLQQRKRRAR